MKEVCVEMTNGDREITHYCDSTTLMSIGVDVILLVERKSDGMEKYYPMRNVQSVTVCEE